MTKILCQICKKYYHFLPPHVRVHGITVKEYRDIFPETELCSSEFKQVHSDKTKKLAKKQWCLRRQRYGSSGVLNPKALWKTRRERYGPMGVKNPELVRKKHSEIMRNGGVQKVWETRKKNDPKNLSAKKAAKTKKKHDPNNESYKRGWETRSKNDPENLASQKIWKSRRKNDPSNLSVKKIWEIRRKKDPNNLAAKKGVKTRKKNDPQNLSRKKAWKTRKKNDPNNLSCKRAQKTRKERYGSSGIKNPQEFSEKRSTIQKRVWKSTSFERREEIIRKIFQSCQRKPNFPEKELIHLFSEEEFAYDYWGNRPYPGLGGLCPDFVHRNKLKIIEHFGIGSKTAPHLHKSEDIQKRIEQLKRFGYDCFVICNYDPKDKETLIRKIKDFTNNTGGNFNG